MPTVSTLALADWQVVIFCDNVPQTIRNELLWSPEHSPDLSAPRDVSRSSPSTYPCQRAGPRKRQGMNAGRDIKENKSNNKNKDTDILTPVSLAPVLPTATLDTDRQVASVTSFRGTLRFCSLLMLMFTHLWSPECILKQASVCVWKSQKKVRVCRQKKDHRRFLNDTKFLRSKRCDPDSRPHCLAFCSKSLGKYLLKRHCSLCSPLFFSCPFFSWSFCSNDVYRCT